MTDRTSFHEFKGFDQYGLYDKSQENKLPLQFLIFQMIIKTKYAKVLNLVLLDSANYNCLSRIDEKDVWQFCHCSCLKFKHFRNKVLLIRNSNLTCKLFAVKFRSYC